MKRIEEISVWSLPDTLQVPDGYDHKTIPDITRDNLEYVIKQHNHLVELVNMLADKIGIEFDE